MCPHVSVAFPGNNQGPRCVSHIVQRMCLTPAVSSRSSQYRSPPRSRGHMPRRESRALQLDGCFNLGLGTTRAKPLAESSTSWTKHTAPDPLGYVTLSVRRTHSDRLLWCHQWASPIHVHTTSRFPEHAVACMQFYRCAVCGWTQCGEVLPRHLAQRGCRRRGSFTP